MLFMFYPDTTEFSEVNLDEIPKGNIAKEIVNLSKKHRGLYLSVKVFLEKIKEADDLSVYFSTGTLLSLKEGLYEMRIPPQQRGGVFRIYYCYKELKESSKVLILLDAELKNEKEANRIEIARKKVTRYLASLKGDKK